MSPEQPNQQGETTEQLRKDVRTGQDNPVQVRPFEVYNVSCPDKWDPSSKDRLQVKYNIRDANRRIVSGRIIYSAAGRKGTGPNSPDIKPVIVHKESLKKDQITHGSHTLQQWDGVVTEGLSDRKGKKVTADLSFISVRVEVWNKSTSAPGEEAGGGKTSVPGEYLSSDSATVDIDAIAKAKWSSNWCIPYDDPDPNDKQHGWTYMNIEVKNILEETPVRIRVLRIRFEKGKKKKSIYDVFGDEVYAETGKDPKGQEGLEGAKVRGGQVLIKNDELPFVQWNRYKEHWKYPDENNFYCFALAFGDRGGFIQASERDYVNKRDDCLHMRFTVFIHCPSTGLKNTLKVGRKIHSFLRSNQVKYFRSYFKEGPLNKEDWIRHVRHRYIVLILGHGGCNCMEASHPIYDEKKKGKVIFKDKKKKIYEDGFSRYDNRCPTEGKPKEESYGGCGNKDGVWHWHSLGLLNGRKNWFGNNKTHSWWTGNLVWRIGRFGEKDVKMEEVSMAKLAPPRFWWEAGVCRSLLTTNLGECFVKSGTRFFSGWIYAAYDEVSSHFYEPLFKAWLKGEEIENLTNRFLKAYAKVADDRKVSPGGPCLIDSRCQLAPPKNLVPPAGPEKALS